MIVTCGGCHTKYLLSDDRVPKQGIRVRCPKCKYVWRLTRSEDSSAFEISMDSFAGGRAPEVVEQVGGGWAALDRSAGPAMHVSSTEASEEERIEEHREEPKREATVVEDPHLKQFRDRSKRLARVFVSDILIYNKDKRDKALANGDLMTVFGPEIKKAWEAYKEKVGPDLPESSQYFREALNEILADGRKIF